MDSLQRLEEIKCIIRSLLISENSQNVTLSYLNKLFKEETDEDIPYLEFYFTSLREFLNSMPDVLDLRYNKRNELFVHHKDTERSKHISSLVARQKKSLPDRRSRSYLIDRNHRIDLYLLQEVLNESAVCSPQNERNKISKIDVLSRVIQRLGQYSFYSMINLNHQLNEYTHLLSHDDDYIYLKGRTSRNRGRKKVLCENNCNLNAQEKYDNDHHIKKNQYLKTVRVEAVSEFVRDSTKQQLQALVKKYPNGIYCHDLPKKFKEEFKWDLEYNDLGFCSVVEFVDALPEILMVVADPCTKKQLILDVKHELTFESSLGVPNSNHPLDSKADSENYDPALRLLPDQASKTSKQQIQMHSNEPLRMISVSSLDSKIGMDIIVSDGMNPSKFWIILKKNKRKLDKLMDELRIFYSCTKNLNDNAIPEGELKPGLSVACKFVEIWHRAIIKRVKRNGHFVVSFCDYGTKTVVRKNELYVLDNKFSLFPTQAILCNLTGVKPLNADHWSKDVSKRFVTKIFNRSFKALISKIDEKRNSMTIDLVAKKADGRELRINDWLITNHLAENGNIQQNPNSIENSQQQDSRSDQDSDEIRNRVDCEKLLPYINNIPLSMQGIFQENFRTIQKPLVGFNLIFPHNIKRPR